MNVESASRFKGHVDQAIKELSLALLVAQVDSTVEKFAAIRKSIGDIIAVTDALLYDSIYPDHPELNDLRDVD
jgi:hypothetical protein